MAEQRVIIEIDRDGKIKAETKGIKGAVCLDVLQKLLGEIDDLESFQKTPEYNEKVLVQADNTIKMRQQ